MSAVVFAIPPCPACGGSSCLAIRVVRIPSSFGIQIFPWYHKSPSFHWHSPSAIPFISFLPSSKLFLMSWISVSVLLAFCISPSSLSWNSVVSSTSSLIPSSFRISQYRSLGSKIPTFRVRLLSPAVGRSPSLLVKASGFPPYFPGRYWILKLYWLSSCIHRACRSFNSFVVMKVTKFLWSVRTRIGFGFPLVYLFHLWNACTIASSSLSYMS